MGGELIAVVAIAGRIGDDSLAGAADPVERLADIGDRALAAAGEDVEIERHRLDPVVGRGLVERPDHRREPIFADDRAAGQHRARVRRRRLLDDRAAKIEPERAAPRAVAIRARRERRIEPAEKGQHDDQDERVLDADQQLPRFSRELHLHAPSPRGLTDPRPAVNGAHRLENKEGAGP